MSGPLAVLLVGFFCIIGSVTSYSIMALSVDLCVPTPEISGVCVQVPLLSSWRGSYMVHCEWHGHKYNARGELFSGGTQPAGFDGV